MDSQTDENNEVKDEEVQEKKPAVEPHEKKTKTPKTIIEKASREETLPKEPEKPAPEATPPTTQKKGTKKTKGKNDFPGAIQIEFEF